MVERDNRDFQKVSTPHQVCLLSLLLSLINIQSILQKEKRGMVAAFYSLSLSLEMQEEKYTHSPWSLDSIVKVGHI